MPRFVFPVIGLLLLAALSAAQSSDRVELFAGYSHVNSDFSLTSPHGLTGWNASANLKLIRHLGLFTDLSGFYPGYSVGCVGCSQSAKIHLYMFGPQASITLGRVTPFARFLFGDSHVDFHSGPALPGFQYFTSNDSFTYGAGGGLDFRLARRIALRAQADWLRTRFQTEDDQLSYRLIPNVARVSTGIVFRF